MVLDKLIFLESDETEKWSLKDIRTDGDKFELLALQKDGNHSGKKRWKKFWKNVKQYVQNNYNSNVHFF